MEKLNLYQKLLHIQTKINGLGKDKTNNYDNHRTNQGYHASKRNSNL